MLARIITKNFKCRQIAEGTHITRPARRSGLGRVFFVEEDREERGERVERERYSRVRGKRFMRVGRKRLYIVEREGEKRGEELSVAV
jgi:hypothetical protein